MESTWSLYGVYRESTWNLHGVYRESTGSLQGVYMEFTWSLHGVYMESTWSLLILEPNFHHQVQNLELYMESTQNLHTIIQVNYITTVYSCVWEIIY